MGLERDREIDLVLGFMERERWKEEDWGLRIQRETFNIKGLERVREIRVQEFGEIERERERLKVRVFQRDIMGQGLKERKRDWELGV